MSSLTLSHRLHRPIVVWWAVLVALLGALAVPLAHAGVRVDGAAGMEVCTSTGPQTIAVDSESGQEFIPYLAHCPFCLHSTDHLAPPPDRQAHRFQVVGEPSAPAVRQVLFFPLHFAAVPPPRGPPYFS